MFLTISYDNNVFDIIYVKDNDQKSLQDAIDIIGNKHQLDLYIVDDKVYDLSEIDDDDYNNDEFDNYEPVGYITVYDDEFLTIEGDIQ